MRTYISDSVQRLSAPRPCLDTEYDIRKLDRGERPRFNPKPDMDWTVNAARWRALSRVLYHTVDECYLEDVLCYGIIPGGFPPQARLLQYHPSVEL